MSTLYMVRHAQASFFSENYDQLSPLGEEQAAALGNYFARHKVGFDAVYSGPAQRHRHTLEIAAEQCRQAGIDWPEPQIIDGMAEHLADKLLQHAVDNVDQFPNHLQPLIEEYTASIQATVLEKDHVQRTFQKLFESIVHLWAEGLFDELAHETWAQFRDRVVAGLEQMTATQQRKQRILCISSVGPIGVVVQHALALDNRRGFEMGWRLRNCSVSEFLFTPDRFTLDSFNSLSHFDDRRLITYR